MCLLAPRERNIFLVRVTSRNVPKGDHAALVPPRYGARLQLQVKRVHKRSQYWLLDHRDDLTSRYRLRLTSIRSCRRIPFMVHPSGRHRLGPSPW